MKCGRRSSRPLRPALERESHATAGPRVPTMDKAQDLIARPEELLVPARIRCAPLLVVGAVNFHDQRSGGRIEVSDEAIQQHDLAPKRHAELAGAKLGPEPLLRQRNRGAERVSTSGEGVSTRGHESLLVAAGCRTKPSSRTIREGAAGAAGSASPPRTHKGDAARAIFYMSVRYWMPIPNAMEADLPDWHRADPPTGEERTRNGKIEKLQGNRKPFVDHPEFVDEIGDF